MSQSSRLSPCVLIVEPSAEEREVLRTSLERRGMRIWEAAEAKAGLELARLHEPDVIVLDLETQHAEDEQVQFEYGSQAVADARPALIILGRACRTIALPKDQVIAKPYHYGPLIHKIEQLAAKAA
ncbi:MAG: response regulator [Pirellulaceae bacterium]